MAPLTAASREARWIGDDVEVNIGSVASFRKMRGRRLHMWDTYYACLWPQNDHQIGESVWDHGDGTESISTSFLIAVIYWGFSYADPTAAG